LHGNRLLWAILTAAVGGLLCGWFFGREMLAIAWLGHLFLDLLQMTIIPLIAASIISGVGVLGDVRRLGRLGGYTVLFILGSTALSVLIGLIVANAVDPAGALGTPATATGGEAYAAKAAGAEEIVRSLVAPNIVAAAAGSNLLPVIVFSLMFGAALTTIGARGRAVSEFFDGLNEAMMKLVTWIMYAAPVGIFALIASRFGEAGGGAEFWKAVSAVGAYVLTVIVGHLIQSGVLYSLLVATTDRGWRFLAGVSRALVMAFGTGSSTATLPLTIECVGQAGVDQRAVRFVLPLGAAMNKNGTALFEAISVMFIAQAYGIDLSLAQQGIILVTATLAAIATAGIPEAGLVTMVIVLSALNLPLEGIALLLSVDWFLDRVRTIVNVWDDCVGAAVIERLVFTPQAQSAVTAADEIR